MIEFFFRVELSIIRFTTICNLELHQVAQPGDQTSVGGSHRLQQSVTKALRNSCCSFSGQASIFLKSVIKFQILSRPVLPLRRFRHFY